jgi:hypothetical protein
MEFRGRQGADLMSMKAPRDLVLFHHVTLERFLFAHVVSPNLQREQRYLLRILFQSRGVSMRVSR